MPFLINGSKNEETLINCLTRTAIETTMPNRNRTFYGLTCYFDLRAIRMLARKIKNAVRQAQGNLIGFHVAVDVGEWIKSRIAKQYIIDKISQEAQIPTESIKFTPVNMTNQLFHAKAYGLVSPHYPNNDYRGFIAVTSGNLTMRGLGIDDHCNVELVEILEKPSALADFVDIMHRISNDFAAPTAIQDEFLLALRIFSAGCFYHKWEGSLGNNVRFQITLTETGKEARDRDQQLFPGYFRESTILSRDPLNIQQIFERQPKPFPRPFWAHYSIDTLIGRWVPLSIAKLVDEVLHKGIEPYLVQIKRLTTRQKLDEISIELKKEVRNFSEKRYIKESIDIVETWKQRIMSFREDRNLISARIFNYEKVPELLDDLDRKTILRSYQSLCNRLKITQTRGLKAIILRATKESAVNLDREIDTLIEGARNMLQEMIDE